MGANRGDDILCSVSMQEIRVSCLLSCSSCFLLDEDDDVDLPRYPGTQVLQEQLHLGCQQEFAGLSRKVQRTMSRPQGLRACFSLPHWPPGSESSLRVFPGCFHAANQKPCRHAPPLLDNKVWEGATTVRGTARCCRRERVQVCVTRRLRIVSRRARCDFAYHPPNFSRLSCVCSPTTLFYTS